ncbi:hypothetical protein A2U01_0048536 [Trifolium medium]|uniref:Uncharacterized protein n=1 Tax=Trifolium medium TaxID=97028 RepID=A0A392QSS6_9FABA|nr:hypothetical protein [Trifolium medium]
MKPALQLPNTNWHGVSIEDGFFSLVESLLSRNFGKINGKTIRIMSKDYQTNVIECEAVEDIL